ncbi:glycoside hydrolase family 31 protein [Bifidobacterium myosotis]
MNWRAAVEGRPLIEPMYWQAPENPDAYEVPDEFRFGTELIVSPVVTPNDKAAMRGRADVWLPQGTWFDFFDGRRYTSSAANGRRLEAWRAIDRIPVFAKAGAIIPLQKLPDGENINSTMNPSALRVLVFPGANGTFTMHEDDGTPAAPTADTRMILQWGNGCRFSIEPASGAIDALPSTREWSVVFRGVAPSNATAVHVTVDDHPVDSAGLVAYDEGRLSLTVTVPDVPSTSMLSIVMDDGPAIAANPVEQDVTDLLLHAQMLYRTKELALNAVHELGVDAISAIRTMNRGPRYDKDFWVTEMPDAVSAAIQEILLRS